MTIGNRILELRKCKGISQEELAEQLSVSRQAVSKWESEQSIPELDKIILLSTFFNVTTDYILKGTEISTISQPSNSANKMQIFSIVASTLNMIGLGMSCFIWYEVQTAIAIWAGLLFMVLGNMIFFVGYSQELKDKQQYRNHYLKINVWVLAFVPLSMLYNMAVSGLIAPYPLFSMRAMISDLPFMPYNWGTASVFIALGLFWVVYVGICVAVTTFLNKNKTNQ